MSLSYSGSLPRSSVTSYQGRKVCWNISSQGTSGSAPDLAGDFQRQSGSPAHNGQPDVWVNPMTDPTNAVSSDQAPSTSTQCSSILLCREMDNPSSSSLVMEHMMKSKAGLLKTSFKCCMHEQNKNADERLLSYFEFSFENETSA